MKRLGTSLKKNKKFFKIILFFILIGGLIGLLIYERTDNKSILMEVKNITTYLNANRINYIFYHFILLSILLVSSITLVGIVLFPIYILFESASILYHIRSFLSVFKLNGLIYSIIYNLLTKGLFLLFFILIFKNILRTLYIIIITLRKKENKEKNLSIIRYIKQIILYFICIIINDIVIYFFTSKILLKLTFILN